MFYSEAEGSTITLQQWEGQLITECVSQGNYALRNRPETPDRWEHLVSSVIYPDGKSYFICTSR